MSLWRFLEKIRAKPEEKRKSMVLFGTVFLTGLIFLFWLIAFVNLNFSTSGSTVKSFETKEKRTPIRDVAELIGNFIFSFKQEVENNPFTDNQEWDFIQQNNQIESSTTSDVSNANLNDLEGEKEETSLKKEEDETKNKPVNNSNLFLPSDSGGIYFE